MNLLEEFQIANFYTKYRYGGWEGRGVKGVQGAWGVLGVEGVWEGESVT